ncbi:MAG: GDP-mannose 4,6-dehydratase [Caulobacterales bacterium]
MSSKRALILGSAGQDGRLLTAFLSSQNYRVIGVERTRVTGFDDRRPAVSLTHRPAMLALMREAAPDEIYYLAAHHHSSSDAPDDQVAIHAASHAVHCDGLSNVLDAMAECAPRARLFYASSCMVFGDPAKAPQSEVTPRAPLSAYAQTKAEGMEIVHQARKQRDLFCASGILYNHESLLRDERFVIPKIVKGAVNVKLGVDKMLVLGDLRARADWGAAEDFVRAMHAMLQIEAPQDFVIGTGKLHSVGEAAELALKTLGIDPVSCLRTDPSILRRPPPAVPYQADIRAIEKATGWTPMISFERMVRTFIEAERSTRSYQAA